MTGRLSWLGLACSLAAAQPCAECHLDIVRRQESSPHARSLSPFPGSPMASALAGFRVAEKNGYQFEYGTRGVTARRAEDSATGTLDWALGRGKYAMTAVGVFNGQFFEHRMSFYTQPKQPGITPGHQYGVSRSASTALGLVEQPPQAFRCFNCHSTGLRETPDGGPDLTTMTPGIHCERCHGPGTAHIAAVRAKRSPAEVRKTIFNSGHLPARASVEVCGGCHRAPRPGQKAEAPELDDPLSVRFQPVGLMASRCFLESGKLSCLTCHDPHANEVRHEPAFYAGKCLGCHEHTARVIVACKREQRQDCQPCHMPDATPAPFLTFTDHRIRVAEAEAR